MFDIPTSKRIGKFVHIIDVINEKTILCEFVCIHWLSRKFPLLRLNIIKFADIIFQVEKFVKRKIRIFSLFLQLHQGFGSATFYLAVLYAFENSIKFKKSKCEILKIGFWYQRDKPLK